ncbi:MAG: hypothetical protein DWQ47_13570 [Acidobacteria bacterium]|nr:MAG: hypothetical protein DWQ32_00970 [Acidobacteriota bacterium]REK02897.1 MAG: hypothetical protein DWQ38_11165 [Acidobacteriota bacterium]REK13299.1 MAG: hypothetical protein DWQ43_06660 [Acidobacteriota bacterium]REK41293.1 MAG: hypothetical protein DWQ47_13570 [Acidobacteriota bacterium]
MEGQYRKFYLEWFNIRKATVYKAIALLILVSGTIGGGMWLWNSDYLAAPIDNANTPRDSARILSYQGDVRIIRVSTRKTERASNGVTVQAGDTIQTQSDGRCQILMIDGSTLSIRPNSTVVIRDSSSLFGGKSVRVKLDDGQIRVRTEDQPDSTNNIVEVKESENRVLAQSEASFNLNRQTDRGEIRVTRGNIVSDSSGVKTTIKQDEYASLNNGQVASTEKLLRPPSPDDPPSSAQIPMRGNSTSVTFAWKRSSGEGNISYQFQLALSPFFVNDKIVEDEDGIRESRFGIAGLVADTYFWRVRAASTSGQQSEWSEPFRLTLYKQRATSRIEAGDWQVEHLGGRLYQISGRTDPGVTVRILGRETFAKFDGSFILRITTSSSSVGVSLSDDKGNKGQYNLSLRSGRAGR